MMLMMVLMHVLVPLSQAQLEIRKVEIAQNVTARLLTEGRFIEPIDGITFYISDITPDGALQNIFLSDLRDRENHVTYTADQAFLVRNQGDAQLVMINGLAQTLRRADQKLFTTTFDDFTYNIGAFIKTPIKNGRRASQVSTLELLRTSPTLQNETGESAARLLATAHDRFSQSVLGLVASLLGFATLMVGGFSRFGVWRQILLAIFLIIVIKAFETIGLNVARQNDLLWFMTYLPSIIGIVIIWCLLFASTKPYLFKRRPKATEVQI